ncbi:hypothetical protein DF182_01055 [Chitinophaga flava]|uniref:DUF4595 domain-containing protein n=2 Tax=Chitinophaga flava TaxID=2259036 RepID=A0A365XY34_9BACT|nr:hypothetical protein DF182_01055 [Chitinophaga flava]
MKHAILLKTGVALFVLAAVSCKKNETTEPPIPIDPPVVSYLPVTVYDDGMPADSFVYNDDNTVAKLYYYYNKDTKKYAQTVTFKYTNGKCVGMERAQNDVVYQTDALVYKGNKVTNYTTYMGGRKDSAFLTLDNRNMVTLDGSKDTLRGSDFESMDYTEFTYANGNLVSHLHQHYYKDNGSSNSVKGEATYSYDDKANTLQYFFAVNPYIAFILSWEEGNMFSTGRNNLTKLMVVSTSGSVVKSTDTYKITNIFDEKTGLLSKQQLTENDKPMGERTYRFIKIK